MKIPRVPAFFFLIPLAVGVEAGLLALSSWQNHRYHQRLAEITAFAARPSVTVSGTFLTESIFALTNQPNPLNPEAETGWRILTPLQTASGTIIVDRGYMPETLNPDNTPNFTAAQISPIGTSTTVSGVLMPFPQRHGWLHGPDITTNPHLLAFLNPSLIISDTTPEYLVARTNTAVALTAVPPPLPSPDRHLSYALQWLGMALAFPVLCIVGWLKNRRAGPRRKRP